MFSSDLFISVRPLAGLMTVVDHHIISYHIYLIDTTVRQHINTS